MVLPLLLSGGVIPPPFMEAIGTRPLQLQTERFPLRIQRRGRAFAFATLVSSTAERYRLP
jgi:hypothetical protein